MLWTRRCISCSKPGDSFPEKEFNYSGLAQLLFLSFCYGYIIFIGSNLIADGSELLLLIPRIAPIVGSVVLPILGAVPVLAADGRLYWRI